MCTQNTCHGSEQYGQFLGKFHFLPPSHIQEATPHKVPETSPQPPDTNILNIIKLYQIFLPIPIPGGKRFLHWDRQQLILFDFCTASNILLSYRSVRLRVCASEAERTMRVKTVPGMVSEPLQLLIPQTNTPSRLFKCLRYTLTAPQLLDLLT